jgi:serine/threonine-protein kinase HipA
LIAVLGCETTGALTFRITGENHDPVPTTFRVVTPEELQSRICSRKQISIANWDGKPRLSVAGVQDKLPLLIKSNGEMGFGEGDLASTHILKFGRNPDMHMVVNEYICMELAHRIKLPVAEVMLKRFGEPVLLVKRFDRRLTKDGVERLHVIDGCQMLDLPPTYKYERPFGKSGEAWKITTGANLENLFAACLHCRIPAAATRDLLRWILFQLLIGNNDAHGKNISFFVSRNGIEVAPAYDLLNTDIYGNQYDQDLAMSVGDAFKIDDIFTYQLAEMCDDCGLPLRQVALSMEALCKSLLTVLHSLPLETMLMDKELPFARELMGKIEKNTRYFLELAEELPRVQL